MLRAPYTSQEVDPTRFDPSTEIHRPILQVRVIGLQDEIPLLGLLDTGASECVIPYEVHEAVRADMNPYDIGPIVDYAGEEHFVRYGTIDLEIPCKSGFLRWSARVAFDEDRKDEALWGHAGFLEYFNATFNGPEKHFTLRLRGLSPPKGIMPRRDRR